MQSFAESLRSRLRADDRPQKLVAKDAAISPQYLTDLLSGHRRPTSDVCLSLARTLRDQDLILAAMCARLLRDGFSKGDILRLAYRLCQEDSQ